MQEQLCPLQAVFFLEVYELKNETGLVEVFGEAAVEWLYKKGNKQDKGL